MTKAGSEVPGVLPGAATAAARHDAPASRVGAEPDARAEQGQTPAAAALEFRAVSKWYGQVAALTDVAFACGPGVTGLVGQNGAGKSTLLKLACGLLRPSQGEVLVHGAPPDRPEHRRRLGFCADVDRFYEHLSGRRFVAWMLRLGFEPRPGAAWRRAGELLDELGLGDAMHRPIATYSKGMRQRVKLAQALAHAPSLLLLDEPLTGLDPVARHEVGDIVRVLGRRGVAVLVSSHVLHELQAVVDRVVLVHQGRLLAEGGIAELREQLDDRPRRLLLRSPDPRRLAARVAELEQVSGVRIREDGVELEAGSASGLYERLTAIGAEPQGVLHEIVPLDDTLEAVFGYLVR